MLCGVRWPSVEKAVKEDPGVLAPIIIKFFGTPSYAFQRGDAFQQAVEDRLFRHVAVPLAVGRRMLPEEKVIPKTDFDLPIATCCSALRSWQGSTTLSRKQYCPPRSCPVSWPMASAGDVIDCNICRENCPLAHNVTQGDVRHRPSVSCFSGLLGRNTRDAGLKSKFYK